MPAPLAPIGIFDSGIGGLTVVKSVMKALPHEDIVYFGDTARVPYGIKSMDTIKEYAFQIVDFLLKKQVKLILIACNTVAAAAEQQIAEKCAEAGIKVLGVITAGVRAAAGVSPENGTIGVIGTLATVGSGAYETALHAQSAAYKIYSKACPLLVPIAEEGWADSDIALQTLEIYLSTVKSKPLDALILGCTHYPLFRKGISQVLDNPRTAIIDSADAIAEMTVETLKSLKLENKSTEPGEFQCYVSDKPQRFQHLAELFLGRKIHQVEIVNL